MPDAPPGNPVGVVFSRSFGAGSGVKTFDAQVTELEEHRDEMVITEHPVETGSPISDHAYVRPPTVTLRLWYAAKSNSDTDYVRATYADLLRLQRARMPFDLYTGKRAYANMLIAGLTVETDQSTEFALKVEMSLRNVIMVNTQTIAAQNQKTPEKTQATADAGAKNPQPAPNVNTDNIELVVPPTVLPPDNTAKPGDVAFAPIPPAQEVPVTTSPSQKNFTTPSTVPNFFTNESGPFLEPSPKAN